MGLFFSRMLCEEELEEIGASTTFTRKEVTMLYERFKWLDRNNNGYITFNELMMLPEFHSNPISILLLGTIEETINYEACTFLYFLDILQIFSDRTDYNERCRFLFKSLDLNKDGRICKKVLERLYYFMLGSSADPKECHYEIQRTLFYFDTGKKGYLDYNDFYEFYNSDPGIDFVLRINFEESCKIYHKEMLYY